jgi:hypothetical protein
MLTTTILALTIGLHQSPSAQEREKQHEEAWVKYLTSLAKQERVQIVFDCTPVLAPSPTAESLGTFGLDVLARRTNRQRIEIEGVQVFVRKQPTGKEETSNSILEVLNVLGSLEPDQLRKLCTDGLDISELQQDQRASLLLALPIDPADCNRAIKGEPFKIALDLYASYEFQSPISGNTEHGTLSSNRFGGWMARHASGITAARPESEAGSRFPALSPPATDGDLDFGEGSIMTLREANERASKQFDTHYFIDGRLAASKYFFSGKFTESRYEDTVNALSEVIPLTSTRPPGQLASHRDSVRALKTALEENRTPYSNDGRFATNNRSLNASELALASGTFAAQMRSLNLSGQDFRVSLVPELSLSVFMPASESGKLVAFSLILGKLGD